MKKPLQTQIERYYIIQNYWSVLLKYVKVMKHKEKKQGLLQSKVDKTE